MLAFDRRGSGPPLLLLHGTTSSRRIWEPLIPTLAENATVFALDLPGHGGSAPTSFTPPAWAVEVASFLNQQGIEQVAVVGHSAGGWTALEVAKLGRSTGVLALAPAGLWRRHSPLKTDFALNVNWHLARLLGPKATATALRSATLRSLSLRTISAKPRQIPAEVAIVNARMAIATDGFPRHFAATRRLRFQGGTGIDVPVKIIWGGRDRIALPGKSRNLDQLPRHTTVETWQECGHMLMWDAPQSLIESIITMQRLGS